MGAGVAARVAAGLDVAGVGEVGWELARFFLCHASLQAVELCGRVWCAGMVCSRG
jgi:hypothetical protein